MSPADLPTRLSGLAALIAAVQQRFGRRALQPGADSLDPEPSPTGVPPLDALLGGGLPRRALTELLGAPTAGTLTLALVALATTQQCGGIVVVVDLPATFDAAYAAACGVDLAALFLIRPETPGAALAILAQLVGDPAIELVLVIELAAIQTEIGGIGLLSTGLRRLRQQLPSWPGVLLVVTSLPYTPELLGSVGFRGSLVGEAADVRVHITREAWAVDDPHVAVCYSRATLLRQRGRLDGGAITLRIAFPPDRRWA